MQRYEKNEAEGFECTEETAEEKLASDTPCDEKGASSSRPRKKPRQIDVKRLVGISTFAALAYGVTFVFRIPVGFLTFDAKDAVIAVASFIYGPVAAFAMSLAAALIELITISGTGWYGFVMNFVSSALFSVTASLIYKYRRSFVGAIAGIYLACFVTVGGMMLMNLFITPFYMGTSRDAVGALIPSLLLPFNAAKVLLNSAIALFLYKPVSQALRRAGLVRGNVNMRFNRQSLILLIICAFTVAAAVALFIVAKAHGAN